MNKIFKSGLLSFLACSVLFQSAVVGYSFELKEVSNITGNTTKIHNFDNDTASTDEIIDDDIDTADTKIDYTEGLEILESSEVSTEFARENDPLYKKYMCEPLAIADTRASQFGVTQPTTPSALAGLDVVDGVDVSMYQAYSTPVNWKKVKDAGISYAIIRCGYRGWGTGQIVSDSYFKQNIEGALAEGLQVGVYFYTQAITVAEAKEEADFCKKAVKGYNITLPIYIDIENADPTGRLDTSGLSKAEKTKICKAFANRVQNAGYTGGVYANKSWLETQINGKALAENFAIWLAHYTTNTDYNGEFSMWQYSSKGSINGIRGSVDINKYYMSKPHKVTGLKAAESEEEPTEFTLSWTCAAGAYKYQVKTYDESTNSWISLGTTKSNQMTVTEPYSITERQYKVRAFKLIGTQKIYGAYSNTVTFAAAVTKVTGLAQTAANTTSVSIKWNVLPDADGYYVYMYNENKKTWSQVQTISGNSNATTKITGLDYSTIYKFRVQGYAAQEDGTILTLIVSDTLETATAPKKAIGLKYTNITPKTVTLTWNVCDKASGYQVLYYDSNKKQYVVCATVSGQSKNSVTVKGLKKGTKYKFKVQAYKTANKINWAGAKSSKYGIQTVPAKVGKLKYSFSGNKCTLTWKARKGAGGYEVQQFNKTTKTWKTVKKIKGMENTEYKFSLASNTPVKYRICAYKNIKGVKRYSKYSSAKTVKH